MKPVITIKSDEVEVSDGYHTFTELYDHRITLYIALAKAYQGQAWRSKVHSDGTTWDDWFLLGLGESPGGQITYHLPMARWRDTDFAVTKDKAPPFDGHAAADVLNRLQWLS
jgi:hypothetical protein